MKYHIHIKGGKRFCLDFDSNEAAVEFANKQGQRYIIIQGGKVVKKKHRLIETVKEGMTIEYWNPCHCQGLEECKHGEYRTGVVERVNLWNGWVMVSGDIVIECDISRIL